MHEELESAERFADRLMFYIDVDEGYRTWSCFLELIEEHDKKIRDAAYDSGYADGLNSKCDDCRRAEEEKAEGWVEVE